MVLNLGETKSFKLPLMLKAIDMIYEGNGLRLDIYYAKSSGMAYMQLFEYIPYKYEACTAVYEYERSKISKLIK